jgi:hypothetical protein
MSSKSLSTMGGATEGHKVISRRSSLVPVHIVVKPHNWSKGSVSFMGTVNLSTGCPSVFRSAISPNPIC